MKRNAAIITVVGVALLSSSAWAGGTGHTHDDEYAFGEPGRVEEVTRTIEITMKETDDGAMIFEPANHQFAPGETVRLKLHNAGEIDHELVLATREENDKHAIEMAKNPDMEHDDPNARRVPPGGHDEIIWKFSKSGTFDLACLIPGHRESGMHGAVVVNGNKLATN
jgi:uncharacterized cupredoxin-like copper-binding protein